MTDLLVYGAGGHGRVVADVARTSGYYVTGFVVDDGFDAPATVAGRPVCRWSEVADGSSGRAFALGIGDNGSRAASAARVMDAGLRVVALVHERAVVAPSARLGRGTVVMAGAVVNPDATLGDGVVVNTGAIVEHDCRVGAFALLGPRCALGGGVIVGDQSLVGLGAVIRPGVRLGPRVVIGAGAAVVADVPDGQVAVGVPARPLRSR
jgi:sugar O-acyltransferase (sialic acid O-acetyltransferase NeuD family)